MAKGKKPWVPDQFKADFVKVSTDFFSKKSIKDKGFLYYQFPKRLRLEVAGKSRIVYVTNPSEIYYYRGPTIKGTPGELVISKSRGSDISLLFDTLRTHGIQSNNKYDVSLKNNTAMITFKKNVAEKLKITESRLVFSSGKHDFENLKEIFITLGTGTHLDYQIQNIRPKKTLKKSLFVFDAPAKTNITRPN